VGGFKSMLLACVVLTLAWSLGAVCTDLSTADFLVEVVRGQLPLWMIPMTVFVVAASVSFATGTSWGTMAILTPLTIPVALSAGTDASPAMLAASVSAILGGAVFGDHCSPISDTTIMSSMASGCDHVDHVRTQLPYALFGAGLAIVVGYVPAMLFDAPSWVLLPLGLIAVVTASRFLGGEIEEEGAESS
jgi:Na+/H+ antiporter NhaC